jgi:PAS domain S-box-containing protein
VYNNLNTYKPVTIYPFLKGLQEQVEAVQQNKFFMRLIQSSPDMIYTVDIDGIIRFSNQRTAAITGFSEDEFIGKHYLEFVAPGHRERVRDFYIQQIIKATEVSYLEFPIITKTGSELWIGQNVAFLLDSKELVYQAIARDISEKHAAEEELNRTKERFENLFSHAVQGMFQSTVDGRIVTINAALLKLLGYESLEELSKINVADLYANPEEREQVAAILESRNRCYNVEFKLKRKDGKIITVVEHARTIRDAAGKTVMYEGIIEDATSKRAIEEQTQHYLAALKNSQEKLTELNAQKDKLFSIVSHDLRSPFSGILGFCDVLINDNASLTHDERMEYLSYIRESATTQLQLVNRLLDWSRLESGRISLEMKETDLRDVVQKSMSDLMGLAMKNNLHLRTNISRGTIIWGDQQLLQQVFNNLIANAIKFTPDGGSIDVNFRSDCLHGIAIDISDTGAGIPPEDLPKLFKVGELYTRTGVRGEEGTGLGLPLCYEILCKHNATIKVESESGKGTTFHLTFQKLDSEQKIKILLIEDDGGIRKLYSRYIRKVIPDVHILHASNGKEGLVLTERFLPTMIISDYSMPVMNGLDFLERVKKNPLAAKIPIVFITGEESGARTESLLYSGAADVLIKPVTPEALQDVIMKLMPEKRLTKQQ